MSINKQTFEYTVRHIVLSSPKPVKAVISALEHELNAEKALAVGVMQMLATAKTREDIETGIGALTEGKRDFLYVSSPFLVVDTWRQSPCTFPQAVRDGLAHAVDEDVLPRRELQGDDRLHVRKPAHSEGILEARPVLRATRSSEDPGPGDGKRRHENSVRLAEFRHPARNGLWRSQSCVAGS